MLGVVVAALAGLFGNGLFSRAERATAGGDVEVAYQRFARSGGTTTLEVSVDPDAARGDQVEVAVSKEYLRRFRVRTVSPQPESTETRGVMIVFVFGRGDAASSLEVELELEPQSAGRARGDVSVEDRPPLRLRQFVYP